MFFIRSTFAGVKIGKNGKKTRFLLQIGLTIHRLNKTHETIKWPAPEILRNVKFGKDVQLFAGWRNLGIRSG